MTDLHAMAAKRVQLCALKMADGTIFVCFIHILAVWLHMILVKCTHDTSNVC